MNTNIKIAFGSMPEIEYTTKVWSAIKKIQDLKKIPKKISFLL